MPVYKLQRLRGGWCIAAYEGGKRTSRTQLKADNAAAAAIEFAEVRAEHSRPVDPTVSQIWAAYRADRAGRRIAENMEWSGRAILPVFGAMKPMGITATDCRAYAKTRAKAGRQAGTICTELAHLRVALAWAVKARIIKEAPYIERPQLPPPKERHLSRAEAERVIAAAVAPHVRLFIILAISTAARATALLELKWDRIDFERGLIVLGDPDRTQRQKGRVTGPRAGESQKGGSPSTRGGD